MNTLQWSSSALPSSNGHSPIASNCSSSISQAQLNTLRWSIAAVPLSSISQAPMNTLRWSSAALPLSSISQVSLTLPSRPLSFISQATMNSLQWSIAALPLSSSSQDPPPTHPLIDLEGYEAVAIDNNVLCYLALAHLSELHTDRNRQKFIMNLLQTGLSTT